MKQAQVKVPLAKRRTKFADLQQKTISFGQQAGLQESIQEQLARQIKQSMQKKEAA